MPSLGAFKALGAIMPVLLSANQFNLRRTAMVQLTATLEQGFPHNSDATSYLRNCLSIILYSILATAPRVSYYLAEKATVSMAPNC